ncbi:MAG: hypothetical protein QOC80_31, partial [Frankiaceae bacterium]|nr:hypothetical protein [Frankiaceae bacterium]
LLSHLAGPHELAQYNLGSQMFGLIVQLINTTGIALWPVFAGARARGEIRSPYPATLAFLGVGVGLATVLALLLPVITPILAGNALRLDGWLVVGFVAFIATQAAKYPLGMYMTSPEGLRFQTLPIVILAPLNLGISWALIAPLGAAGPILGSAISVTLCQVIPNYFYVRRDLRRRRAARQDAVTADLVLATDYPT